MTLKMPKLRRQTFEAAIIRCYRVEMRQTGISVRGVQDITQVSWEA